jgi:predicted permease
MLNDLRFAFRTLTKSPRFTSIAVLTLAIGIGATTAMFSTLRALVLDPVSLPDPDRIVHVWSGRNWPLSNPDFIDLREQATSFESFGAYSPRSVNLGGEHAEVIRSIAATHGVLESLGVIPESGRPITEADCVEGGPRVAVISHALWQRACNADPDIVGKTIRINSRDTTVIGVLPADFELTSPWMRTAQPQIWQPRYLDPEAGRGSHNLLGVARLKEGVTVAHADAEIKSIGLRLKEEYPNTNTHKAFMVRSLRYEATRGTGERVWMLFGAVVLILLVSCINVASMLLARSARRQGEFGVRVALGASPRHLIQLALVESLMLAFAGTVVGLLLAIPGTEVLKSIAPVSDVRKAAMGLDLGALAFACGMAVLAALIAGLPPAMAASRTSVAAVIREDSRTFMGSRNRHRFLRALIVVQIAIAFILTNGAALFSSGYMKMTSDNRKMATETILTAQFHLRGEIYEESDTREQFWNRLVDEVAVIPGVSAAGIVTRLPLEGGSNTEILVNDEVFDPTAKPILAEWRSITPGYFDAAGIALLQGRTLEESDRGEDTLGVVVNQTLVEMAWPEENPIGKLIRNNDAELEWTARVVGVVENIRQWGPEEPPRPEMFTMPDRAWGRSPFLVVRSEREAIHLAPAIRKGLARLDSDLPLGRVRTFQMVMDQAMQGHQAVAQLIDFFMITGLLLAAVGVYGTLSFTVAQRNREFGLRVALGAMRGDILRLVLHQATLWMLIGIVAGVVGVFLSSRALSSIVYGVESIDPLSMLGATLAVALAILLASLLPARRASVVDPQIALRTD